MTTIAEVKNHLIGLSHGGTINKVRNINQLFLRAALNLLSHIRPLETIRTAPLTSTIHNKLYNYAAPSDFDGLIGIYPQSERSLSDTITRGYAEPFDRRKAIDDKQISIEGDNGTKLFRINYRSREPKVLSSMNTYDGNGTWSAVATASGVATDSIYKYSGSGSVVFDLAASGDGIQNTTLTALDLTDEDEVADVILAFYIKDSTDLGRLTSVTAIWGNDVTTNYWTGVAQTTQADGTAFKVGWNIIKIPWSTATESGTVTPSTVDSFKITFAITGAITNIRVDNILFSIGYPFDIKYYSKYLFQTSANAWLNQPTSDTDYVILDNDALNIYLYECLMEMGHQVEGEDSAFDLAYARVKLWGDGGSPDPVGRIGLYADYRTRYPDQSKKAVTDYGMKPNFSRYG